MLIAASAALPESFAADRLEQIRARGVLRWGADAEGGAPYVYPDPDDPSRLVGFEWDLANALAARLGVRAEMVQNQWDQLIPALARGNFDIILNGLELTRENRERVAMSRPYFVYGQQIVTRPEDTDLNSLERLRAKTVGVLSGSAAERLVKNAPGVIWKSYPGNVESFQDLKVHRLDAALVDSPIAVHYVAPDASLSLAGRPFAHGYYAIGLLPEDGRLLRALNEAIDHLARDGTLEQIHRKYGIWDETQTQLSDFKEEEATRSISPRQRGWRQRLGYIPLLLRAAVITIQLSVLGMGLAVVAGLGVALVRLYGPGPLSWLAKSYIEVFRGTPLLIQLFLIYYGLPEIGIRLNAFVAAVVGLGLNYAANEAENYRAGIQSVPHGQTEAALALGMTRWQTLRYVVLPQAARVAIPPVTNDFIAMFKDTSIVSVITMVELTKQYGMLAASNSDYIVVGLMTAGIYFGLSYPASILAGRVEAKLRYDQR
jgi:polar amino acid transport system substrate-binding protein